MLSPHRTLPIYLLEEYSHPILSFLAIHYVIPLLYICYATQYLHSPLNPPPQPCETGAIIIAS